MLDIYMKILGDAPPGKTFRTGFGEIRNLSELKNYLVEKGKNFYDQYVYSNENHFANWILGVFKDNELAESIQNINSYTTTIKLLDDRIKYAELWLTFNSSKELLIDYLTNGPLSMKNYIDAPDFEPTHHKFEREAELTNIPQGIPLSLPPGLPQIPRPSPPKATILPEITFNPKALFEKQDLPPLPTEEILRNSQILQNTTEIRHKTEKDKELLKELETQFPGLKFAEEPPRKKGFFEKLFKSK